MYILGHLPHKNLTRKIVWTILSLCVLFYMSKWLDIYKDFWTISSLCVSKWPEFHKDFGLFRDFVCQNVPILSSGIQTKSITPSSDMQKFHQLKYFTFFKFTMPIQKSNNIFTDWQNKLFWLDWKLKQYA